MKRIAPLAIALSMVAGFSQAQDQPFVPGQEFMLQWDLDSDGNVTLDEAREQRGNIFAMFDADSNGSFSDDELAGIDDYKAMQAEFGKGPGHNAPDGRTPGMGQGQGQGMGQGQGQGKGQGQGLGKGPGQGQGKGMGQGQGQGMGQGRAMGFDASAFDGMPLFDADKNGVVTEPEFIAGTSVWFTQRDRNGDGVLTLEDFGNGR